MARLCIYISVVVSSDSDAPCLVNESAKSVLVGSVMKGNVTGFIDTVPKTDQKILL